MYSDLLLKYNTSQTHMKEITSFIKNINNPLQERFNMFFQVLDVLPFGQYLSDWSLTNRSSPAYDSDLASSHYRGAIYSSSILECILDSLYQKLPVEYYEQYGDDIPLEILYRESPSVYKDVFKIQIEAILQDCKQGVILDW